MKNLEPIIFSQNHHFVTKSTFHFSYGYTSGPDLQSVVRGLGQDKAFASHNQVGDNNIIKSSFSSEYRI